MLLTFLPLLVCFLCSLPRLEALCVSCHGCASPHLNSQESRGVSPCRSGAPEVGLSLQVLALCAEKALLLLLTQATLALMSPDTAPRDAQRIRQNMADDMVGSLLSNSCLLQQVYFAAVIIVLVSENHQHHPKDCSHHGCLQHLQVSKSIHLRWIPSSWLSK